jgi:hypothetical protein
MDFDRTRHSKLITEYLAKKQKCHKINKQAMFQIHNFMQIRAVRDLVLALMQTNISLNHMVVKNRFYIYAAANFQWRQLNT